MDPSIDASTLAVIAAEIHEQPDEERTVSAIVAHTSEVVPDAEHVSLTVRRHREWLTLAASSDLADRADAMQYRLEQGPCLDAAIDSDWLRSSDVPADPRWPSWAPQAADLGVRSLLSVTLHARDDIGALNMYSTEPGRFGDRDVVDLALVYAVHVAYALSSARVVSGLQAAMSSRHTIGLAQGILMERYDLDADRAFGFLRRISSVQNRKLRDVAAELVELRKLHGRGVDEI